MLGCGCIFILYLCLELKISCSAFCNRHDVLSATVLNPTRRQEFINAKVKSFCCACERRQPTAIQVARDEDVSYLVSQKYHYGLTILIPAYNEVDRIGNTLSTYISYLQQSSVCQCLSTCAAQVSEGGFATGTVTILVIDDGSLDGTADFVRGKSYLARAAPGESSVNCWKVDENVQCISLAQNEGKGAAIEKGMQVISTDHNSGGFTRHLVLVVDADGSGGMSCLNDMIQQLEMLLQTSEKGNLDSTTEALVIGYRVSKDKPFLRRLLSWGFRTAVSSIFLGSDLGVRDTQCGFKLMTLSTGKKLYNDLNLRRWTHDVEILHRAQRLGIPVGESEVPWVDAEGSKLVTSTTTAITMSLVMLKEIATMRVNYLIGHWR